MDPVELLQRLIRFDTTNPPGDEAECVGWIQGLCAEAGIDTRLVEQAPGRPNLIARLPGRGAAPPLLLQGHVDVVTTAGQQWARDPFGGELVDGCVWGRGALDMKGGVAIMVSALHVTDIPRAIVQRLAAALGEPGAQLADAPLDPARTDATLDALGEAGAQLDAILHNTVNATVVRGGDKINVVPSEIVLELDGRPLPGQTADGFLAELAAVADDSELEWAVITFQETPANVDLSQFDMLASVLTDAEPAAVPLPFLLPGVTDGRFFVRLGIQTYGFLPLRLAPDFSFTTLIRAADERVPAEEIRWGADRVLDVLTRYGR